LPAQVFWKRTEFILELNVTNERDNNLINAQSSGQDDANEESSVESIESARLHRRQLLKGLGAGSVGLLTSTVPIKSIASETVLLTKDGRYLCTISGVQSGIGSRHPSDVNTCNGYTPGWWGQCKCPSVGSQGLACTGGPLHWPSSYAWRWDTPYNQVFPANSNCPLLQYPTFGCKALNGTVPTLFLIENDKNHWANTDMFHWVCAYLNSCQFYPKGLFPYSPQEVIGFYNSQTLYASALAFFKNYTENV
jgi:hypothetical protein